MSNCSYGPNGVIPRDRSFTSGVRSQNVVACTGKFSSIETNSALINDQLKVDEIIDPQNVKYHGAVGDGVTDDTVAIQTALTAQQDGNLFFPAGTYIVTEELTVPSDITITGYDATLDFSTKATWSNGTNDALVQIRGTKEATSRALVMDAKPPVNITVSAGAGTRVGTTVTYNTGVNHNLSTGDYVWITGFSVPLAAGQLPFYTSNGTSSVTFTEPVQVTVTSPTQFTYTVANTGDLATTSNSIIITYGNIVSLAPGGGTGLAPGDWVLISSDDVRTDGSQVVDIGEMQEVKYVFGDVVITRAPMQDTYLVASNAKLEKLEPKYNITIEGLTVIGKGPNESTVILYGDRGIGVEHVVNITIRDCKFREVDQMCILMWTTYGGHIENNIMIFNPVDEAGRTSGQLDIQYGIAVGAATSGTYIVGNKVQGSRHGVVESTSSTRTGVTRNITVNGNYFYGSWLGAVSTHQACDTWVITNNVINGCFAGIDCRYGARMIFNNNIIDNARYGMDINKVIGDGFQACNNTITNTRFGIWINSPLDAASMRSNLMIKDNIIENCENGIRCLEDDAGINVTDWHITGNTIRNCDQYGVRMTLGTNAADGWSGSLINNSVTNFGLTGSNNAFWLVNMREVIVDHNLCTVGTGAGTRMFYVDGAGNTNVHFGDSNKNVGASLFYTINNAGNGGFRMPLQYFSSTTNVGSVAAGAEATFTITATGFNLGSRVVETGTSVDIGALIMTARVTALSTITVSLFNPTGAPIDPPSATYTVGVRNFF